MQQNEITIFIKQNAPYIVEYINCEVLKEIGTMNPNYFVKLVNDSFVKQTSIQDIDINILPYYLFTQIESKGRMDYTSLRTETISLNKLNDEAKVYYNYARFTLNKDFFIIDLMQTKIGGMPIDEDIVKFSKQVPISNLSLEEFIEQHKETEINETLKRVQKEVEKL